MTPIELFQTDLDGRLKSYPFFADKPSYVYRPRGKETLATIDTRINNILAGRLKQGGHQGVALAVFMPVTDIPDADPFYPEFKVTGTIRISENVVLNMSPGGTKCSAEEIGIQVVMLMRNFFAQGLYNTVTADREAMTPVGTLADDDNVLIYDLKFVTQFGLVANLKTQSPIIGGSAAAVTLTCPDGAAVIYYTTDLSYPRPSLAEETALGAGNPNTSQLYAAPFAVENGTVVRACAYHAPQMPSNVSLAEFTTDQNNNPITTDQGISLPQ